MAMVALISPVACPICHSRLQVTRSTGTVFRKAICTNLKCRNFNLYRERSLYNSQRGSMQPVMPVSLVMDIGDENRN